MGDLHRDRGRAEGFGSDAERYDRTRPTYPDELVAWLTDDAPGTAVDVGCGTGQVAGLLVAAGWRVVGVEVDERMADVARAKGLTVDVARFEEWRPSVRDVDLVCCGQAWHWIDPDAGLDRAATVLRRGGRLVLFWNAYRYSSAVQDVIGEVYSRHAPELLVDSVSLGTADPGHSETDRAAIAAIGHFAEPTSRVFEHHRRLTIDQWLDELATHSSHQLLDPARTQPLVAELAEALTSVSGDEVVVRYETRASSALRI